MALEDVAVSLTDPDAIPWRTCQVCHYVESLTPNRREMFEGLLSNRGVKYTAIEASFRSDPDLPDLEISAIRRHGNGVGSAHTVKFR